MGSAHIHATRADRMVFMGPQAADDDLIEALRSSESPIERGRLTNQLFERHYSRVGLWCFRFTGDRESARDLAQEVFLRALRGLDTYQGTSKFSSWLYVIARNQCIKWVQRQSAKHEQPQDPSVLDGRQADFEAADERLERHASADLVRELMAEALDETERKVMILHYAEDVPLAAVSRLLALQNASGAKAFIVSAKRKLNRALRRRRARDGRLLNTGGQK